MFTDIKNVLFMPSLTVIDHTQKKEVIRQPPSCMVTLKTSLNYYLFQYFQITKLYTLDYFVFYKNRLKEQKTLRYNKTKLPIAIKFEERNLSDWSQQGKNFILKENFSLPTNTMVNQTLCTITGRMQYNL